jgi:hypothetical protein
MTIGWVVTAGCVDPHQESELPFGSLQDNLRQGAWFTATAAEGPHHVLADIGGKLANLGPSAFLIEQVEIALRLEATDRLVMDSLSIQLRDISMPAMQGWTLRNVRLSIDEPVTTTVQWYAVSEAFATAQTDVQLDWSMAVDDGPAVAFPTHRIREVGLALELNQREDVIMLHVLGERVGLAWGWSDLITVSDVVITIAADARF